MALIQGQIDQLYVYYLPKNIYVLPGDHVEVGGLDSSTMFISAIVRLLIAEVVVAERT